MAKGKKTNVKKSAATLGKRRLRERAAGCAARILEEIQDISFEKLATALYFFCADLQTEQFVHRFEAVIELAGANPERFKNELHDFFVTVAEEIKAEGRYQEFFEFLGLCVRIRTKESAGTEKRRIIDAYMCLLMQQMEYLRPNLYDFSVVVCGITTDGEVMTVPDYFPEMDMIPQSIKNWKKERIKRKPDKPIGKEEEWEAYSRVFADYGYKVRNANDLSKIQRVDDLYTNQHSILAQYINEYTYDILPDPQNAFTSFALPFYAISVLDCQVDTLVSKLKKRARTLPTNGVDFVFDFDNLEAAPLVEKIRMKEILYADRVIMLYRMWTCSGEMSGYYDTKDGYLYSLFIDVNDRNLCENMKTFLLYFYSAMVIRDGMEMLKEISDKVVIRDTKDVPYRYSVKLYGDNGKLINVYEKDGAKRLGAKQTKLRVGDPAYIGEVRTIQGFVRKVGVGKKPSQEAVARAVALGYDLAPDETYVQGFFRTVLKLKERKTVSKF